MGFHVALNIKYQMKTKPAKGLIFLRVPRETIGVLSFGDGIKFVASTKFHKEKFHPQYSEVVAVADDVKHIKPGDWVFHNHNAIGEVREVAPDIYYQPVDLIYGTKEKMFGDYVMVEPYLENRIRVAGSISAPEMVSIQEEAKDKVIVVLGEETGKSFYCSHLMFYEIIGADRKLYIAKKKELWCDEDLNPIGERTICTSFKKMISAGAFVVEDKSNFEKQLVVKSSKYPINTFIHFLKNRAGVITHNKQPYYVVDDRFIFGYENL